MHAVSDIDLVPNSGDFKLLSRRAMNELLKLTEQKPYVRGFYPTLNDNHPYRYIWIDRNWKESSGEKQVAER